MGSLTAAELEVTRPDQPAATETAERFAPQFDRAYFAGLVSDWLNQPDNPQARALLYLRPDNFSEIDERFGPLASDELLLNFGHFIDRQLGNNTPVVRFGGTIFTALLEQPSMEEILAVAEKLRFAIAEAIFETSSHSTRMTASIGIIELSELVDDEIQAIGKAQAAVRKARELGGDQVLVDTSLEASSAGRSERLRWSGKIRRGLDDDDFRLVYQPMACLTGDSINQYDVLVRMCDERGEEMLPAEFMPAAESTGQMPAIDRRVIEQALSVAAARWTQGVRSRIFIRVSEASLHEPHFLGWLGIETLKHKLDPEGIVLQIEEAVAERNLALARQLGQTCKDLHLKLSLGNAGVSTHGLELIDQLPVDFLVLDGGFTKRTGDASENKQAHRLITAARTRGIQIIASRVENATALSRLVHLGVDYVIGYHVHQPEDYMVDTVMLPPDSELPPEDDDEDAGWEIEGF